jgi:hypothetical protein
MHRDITRSHPSTLLTIEGDDRACVASLKRTRPRYLSIDFSGFARAHPQATVNEPSGRQNQCCGRDMSIDPTDKPGAVSQKSWNKLMDPGVCGVNAEAADALWSSRHPCGSDATGTRYPSAMGTWPERRRGRRRACSDGLGLCGRKDKRIHRRRSGREPANGRALARAVCGSAAQRSAGHAPPRRPTAYHRCQGRARRPNYSDRPSA